MQPSRQVGRSWGNGPWETRSVTKVVVRAGDESRTRDWGSAWRRPISATYQPAQLGWRLKHPGPRAGPTRGGPGHPGQLRKSWYSSSENCGDHQRDRRQLHDCTYGRVAMNAGRSTGQARRRDGQHDLNPIADPQHRSNDSRLENIAEISHGVRYVRVGSAMMCSWRPCRGCAGPS